MRLEIEKKAIEKEKDDISSKRTLDLKDQIAILKKQEEELRQKWEKEKNINDLINRKKEELETAKFKLEQAENKYDLEQAAILRHGTIPKLEKDLENLRKVDESNILSDTVDENSIAEIISKWTKIPVKKLVGGEKEKLLNLKNNMMKRVKGQEKVSFPRPSYDGRFLCYTLADYGQFSIWHHEADLCLLDLSTGQSRPMAEANSEDTESFHNWSTNSRWIVFSSRRDDGLFTRLYFCHVDAKGIISKAFMLPQRNPRRFYRERFLSFNVPDFIISPTRFDSHKASRIINDKSRKDFGVRQIPSM